LQVKSRWKQAIALAVEHNPDLAAVAHELDIAQSDLERANYFSEFNPELVAEGDYRDRGGHSNSQEWPPRLSQQLEIFGQPALRRRSASYVILNLYRWIMPKNGSR